MPLKEFTFASFFHSTSTAHGESPKMVPMNRLLIVVALMTLTGCAGAARFMQGFSEGSQQSNHTRNVQVREVPNYQGCAYGERCYQVTER